MCDHESSMRALQKYLKTLHVSETTPTHKNTQWKSTNWILSAIE